MCRVLDSREQDKERLLLQQEELENQVGGRLKACSCLFGAPCAAVVEGVGPLLQSDRLHAWSGHGGWLQCPPNPIGPVMLPLTTATALHRTGGLGAGGEGGGRNGG